MPSCQLTASLLHSNAAVTAAEACALVMPHVLIAIASQTACAVCCCIVAGQLTAAKCPCRSAISGRSRRAHLQPTRTAGSPRPSLQSSQRALSAVARDAAADGYARAHVAECGGEPQLQVWNLSSSLIFSKATGMYVAMAGCKSDLPGGARGGKGGARGKGLRIRLL